MRAFRSIAVAISLIASAIPAFAPADAQHWGRGRGGPPADYRRQGYDGYPPPRGYDGPLPGYYRDRGSPRNYRRCNRGTGGSIIGAIAGGLLGNAVAGRGDRGIGTILGAGAGALTGRAIDRDC